MKRLPIVCLLILLSLIFATSAIASPRAKSEHARAQLIAAATPDSVIDGQDARNESPAADSSRAAEPAAKASPSQRKVGSEQEIGDGHCFEYVIFGIWHVWWYDCPFTGGGASGGW